MGFKKVWVSEMVLLAGNSSDRGWMKIQGGTT